MKGEDFKIVLKTMGLPDRDFYTGTEDQYVSICQEYGWTFTDKADIVWVMDCQEIEK